MDIVKPQIPLGLFSITETSNNDLPMGVLSDGTPYLTARGLSKVCGVDIKIITRLILNWAEEQQKPRGKKIHELLSAQEYHEPQIYIDASGAYGPFYAIPDAVCMAFLEYYAFDANHDNKETARNNYRFLARSSFKIYVYDQCNYNPAQKIDASWQNFQDRLLLNDDIPLNYFSIFKELSSIILNMIRGGCRIDDATVPDISVGQIWGKYWTQNNLKEKYGDRCKYPHVYPDTFRQSSGGDYEAWIYPSEALGVFRRWLHEIYLMEKFPKYLNTKTTKGVIGSSEAIKLLDVLQKPQEIHNSKK